VTGWDARFGAAFPKPSFNYPVDMVFYVEQASISSRTGFDPLVNPFFLAQASVDLVGERVRAPVGAGFLNHALTILEYGLLSWSNPAMPYIIVTFIGERMGLMLWADIPM
jgi:hypothetical protein